MKILGLEEMLKLAEILKTKQVALKKAAGEELVVWNGPEEEQNFQEIKDPGKVLAFRGREQARPQLEEESSQAKFESDPVSAHFTPVELMLWQKELTKDSEVSLQKQEAFKGYKNSTEMYIVKTEVNGAEKIRIPSTNGVLVNKKQA